jgi:hypothetical protein
VLFKTKVELIEGVLDLGVTLTTPEIMRQSRMNVDYLACELNCIQHTLNVKFMENKFLQLSELVSNPTARRRELKHTILSAQGFDDSPIGT